MFVFHFLMWTPNSGVRGVVGATNKITWTAEVLWRKGTAWLLSVCKSAPTLVWKGFYCFLGALYQGRSSFIMLRFDLSDYSLQIKKRMLQMLGNDESD